MTIDITVRWAGPTDAASGSTYKIERTLDNSLWTTLAAGQAATSPYASPQSVLSGNTSYGATSVVLTSGTAFSASGYGWIDDALIQWTGKSTNTLTGVTWHSGYGTYAAGSVLYEAHESYADTGVTITLNAALYRITHITSSGSSAPTYFWFFAPPTPASNRHCVVIVPVATDLGVEMQSDVSVVAYLSTDRQFGDIGGEHLDSNSSDANTATTNAFGLAFFHCWRDSARSDVSDGTDAAYTFVLKPNTGSLTLSVATIPDRDWILLSQIA